MTPLEDKVPLVVEVSDRVGKERARMTTAAGCHETHDEDRRPYYIWLEDHLARLEGEEAYRVFQELDHDTPEYYELVASLMA
jgi:hypothetical protein